MKVGPFELMHMLASSAESERWLARGPVGAATVEVWTATDAALRAEMITEAKAAMVLDHANIARLISAGESDSSAWLAMPADMADDLESVAPLPPSFAARVVHDAATALAYAHGGGRVHGALNGHLLLIGYDGVVRATGFGAARVMSSERAKIGALTPSQAALLSPEVLSGGKITPASDVYTLGRLLALAVGDPNALPVALRAIHDQCIQAEPGSRLPSAAAVALAVSEAAARELDAMPSAAELATYLRETLPTRREERVRQWASVSAGIPNSLSPVAFNIPRDPSNPGSSIPLFDAAITTLFVREQSSSDPPPDPLKQAAPIAGTWAALSTAFASPTPATPASLPPMPLPARTEEDRDDKTVQVVVAMLALSLIAFFVGALYLGPSAQADLSEADKGRGAAAPVVAPDLPVLSVSDPALWVVPGVPVPTPVPSASPAPRGR